MEERYRFVFRDEQTGIVRGFEFLGFPANLDLADSEAYFYDHLQPEQNARDLENRHGVHDVACNSDRELWGFSSYEVGSMREDDDPEQCWKALMIEWREIFESLGFVLGPDFLEVEV